MDKAKILRMCNEIEDEVTDIAFNSTHNHIYDCCESIREYLKAIAAEITAPPKSNADRIRQMTDEELAEYLGSSICDRLESGDCQRFKNCEECKLSWILEEVSEDAGTD